MSSTCTRPPYQRYSSRDLVYRRATTETDAPGANVATTISRFSAPGHERLRRRSGTWPRWAICLRASIFAYPDRNRGVDSSPAPHGWVKRPVWMGKSPRQLHFVRIRRAECGPIDRPVEGADKARAANDVAQRHRYEIVDDAGQGD
jgi:hypothetical protein